jgi:hypothetical protein
MTHPNEFKMDEAARKIRYVSCKSLSDDAGSRQPKILVVLSHTLLPYETYDVSCSDSPNTRGWGIT